MIWISCDKQKPEEGQEVLLYAAPFYYVGEWNGDYYQEQEECKPVDATHWKPLPEPPK